MMYIVFLFLVFLVFSNARLGERDSIKEKSLITNPSSPLLRGQRPLPSEDSNFPRSVPLQHPVHEIGVFKKNSKLDLRKLFAKHAKCIERYAETMVPSEWTTPNDYFGQLAEYWMNPERSFEDTVDWLCKKLII